MEFYIGIEDKQQGPFTEEVIREKAKAGGLNPDNLAWNDSMDEWKPLSEVFPGMELAIDSGNTTGQLEGHQTKDPVFGLQATWINAANRDQAQAMGYMVFNPGTVITTHLDKIIVDFAPELLGQGEVQHLLLIEMIGI